MKRSLGNHHQVAHVWASQSQSEGYGSNMLFEGPSIYSYGTHFEIARIVRPGIVFFNPARYSVSTSKHQSRAMSAVSHMKTFTVPSMTDLKANAEYLLKNLETELYALSRARKGVEFKLQMYQGQCEEAFDYADTFKKDIGAKLYNAIIKVWQRRAEPFTPALKKAFETRAQADKARAKADKARKEKEVEARKAEFQADYDGWKRGTLDRLPWQAVSLFPTALRVRDNEIETTRGASIPVVEAKKFWHTLTDSGKVEGMRLGHYTVTSVRDGILTVGCHSIPLREVARMAIKLGLDKGTVDGLTVALEQTI